LKYSIEIIDEKIYIIYIAYYNFYFIKTYFFYISNRL